MTVYLQPNGPIAARALLPGDPKRAMELANLVLEKPLMSNLSRGLWGYHGSTPTGEELTVQATGIGAPSATIVLHEMASLGLARAVRVGTCVALDEGFEPGTFVLASKALDSRGGTAAGALADAGLASRLEGLLSGDTARATVAPIERYYDADSAATQAAWTAAGASIADLCSAALLESAGALGVALASVLVVAEDPIGRRIGEEQLDSRLQELGEIAAKALLGDEARAPAATF